MENYLLTIKELSLLLSVKESWVRSMIFKKKIPYVQVGRLIRFDRDEIRKWLERQKNSPP